MTLNDVLTKQNVITKLLLADDNKELSKALKVKIMRIRMAYNKAKKRFDEDTQDFVNQLINDDFKELANKQDKTEEEMKSFEEQNNKINSEYQEFLIQKGLEEVEQIDDTFTEEDYSDLVDVNSNNNVEINGTSIKAPDFLEIVYDLFVKKED